MPAGMGAFSVKITALPAVHPVITNKLMTMWLMLIRYEYRHMLLFLKNIKRRNICLDKDNFRIYILKKEYGGCV
jgi:hypothetical protein